MMGLGGRQVGASATRALGAAGSSGKELKEGVKGLEEAGQSLQGAAGGFDTNAIQFADNGTQFAANAAQFGLSAGGLLLSGIGIATNSQALVIAGSALQLVGMVVEVAQTLAAGALTGAAGSLGIAATMLMAAAAVPFFHSGGVVAHGGWLVAHDGLAPDERRVIAKVDEGIIKASTMDRYRQAGISFNDLNNGGLPVIPIIVAKSSGQEVMIEQLTFAPVYQYRPTQADMNRDAKMMVKALKREMGNKFGG